MLQGVGRVAVQSQSRLCVTVLGAKAREVVSQCREPWGAPRIVRPEHQGMLPKGHRMICVHRVFPTPSLRAIGSSNNPSLQVGSKHPHLE